MSKKLEQRLFNVEQTARYLGVSRGHLYNLISMGSTSCLPVKPVRVPGGGGKRSAVRFDKQALDKWISNQMGS